MASLPSLREGLESEDYNEALKQFLQGHHIGLKLGDATGASLCSKLLMQAISADEQSSQDLWTRLSILLAELGDCEGEEQAWAAFYTGFWELWRGRESAALEWLQESYRLATTDLLKLEVCEWLGNLHDGDLSLAVQFYREQKEAAFGLQQRDLQVCVLYKLCQVLCQLEKIDEAQEEHARLETLANQSEDPFARGAEKRIKAYICGRLLQHHESNKANVEAVGLLQQLQAPKLDDLYYQSYLSEEPDATLLCPRKIQIALVILMSAWDDIGTYEFLFGDPKLGLDAFSQEKTLAIEHESGENLMGSLSGLSNICCILGRLAEAEAYAAEMLEMSSSKSIDALVLLARIEYHKSCGFQQGSSAQEAFQIASKFLAKAEDLSKNAATKQMKEHRSTVHYWQAFLRMKVSKNGCFEEAIELYEESIRWFNLTETSSARTSLGRIAHFERAKTAYRELQLCLLNSEPEQAKRALVWAEQGRARDLVYELRSRGHMDEEPAAVSFEEDNDEAWKEIESVYSSAGGETVFLVFTQLNDRIVVTYLLHAGEEPKFRFSHDETSDHRVHESSIAAGLLDMPIFSLVEELLSDHVQKKKCSECKGLTYYYLLLIEPWEAELERIKPRKIVLIPTEELSILPFAALRDPKTEDEEGSCFLIERYALSYAPSLRVFKHCESQLRKLIGKRGAEDKKKALVVGNPKLKQQEQLPNAESEAVSIAETLRKAGYVTELLLQDAATTEAVLGAIPSSHWVHIASHAVVDQRFPFGAVLLSSSVESQQPPSQQKLTFLSISRNIHTLRMMERGRDAAASREEVSGEEMTRAELKAMVVVLSACSTGLGHVSGEGMLGLSRSLHLAGVAATIVSLWNVDDRATKQVFDLLYENLSQGMELIFALQAAMKSMIELEDDWGHKVHEVHEWAPFMISGSILAKLT